MDPVNVILVCPCCASPVDARSGDEVQDFLCLVCDQSWQMVVDQVRQAVHSLT